MRYSITTENGYVCEMTQNVIAYICFFNKAIFKRKKFKKITYLIKPFTLFNVHQFVKFHKKALTFLILHTMLFPIQRFILAIESYFI